MKRTKEEAAATRETLMKTALQVFSQKGYTAATLEDIARAAGVTRGAIYWHFHGKAELYRALLEQYTSLSGAIIQAAAAEGGTLTGIIRRIFVRMLEAVEHDAALRQMMEISLFKTEHVPELAPVLQQQGQASQALVRAIAEQMRAGIERGELRAGADPMEMARAFLALQNGLIYLWLSNPQAFSLAGSAPAQAEIYLKGILPDRNDHSHFETEKP